MPFLPGTFIEETPETAFTSGGVPGVPAGTLVPTTGRGITQEEYLAELEAGRARLAEIMAQQGGQIMTNGASQVQQLGMPEPGRSDLAVRTNLPFRTTPPSGGPGSLVPGAQPLFDWGAAAGIGLGIIRGLDLLGNGNGMSTEEAFLDAWGLGMWGREGAVGPGRTTEGTGFMAAGTFRGWDPVKQRYYGISKMQGQAYQGITFAPGEEVPGAGTIVKAWATHSIRKDESMATTQFARTADGRIHSLSEVGVLKSWRPYKSIVIGKCLTSANVRRVSRRIKSHAKSLKKVLNILK